VRLEHTFGHIGEDVRRKIFVREQLGILYHGLFVQSEFPVSIGAADDFVNIFTTVIPGFPQ